MTSLARRTLRNKISLSFGWLTLLVAINAVVGITASYTIARQIERQEQVRNIIEHLDDVDASADRFIRTRARDAQQRTFQRLDVVRRELGTVARDGDRLVTLLDDYQLQFQKFVVEADEKAALESRAAALGRRLIGQFRGARALHLDTQNHEALEDVVFSHILDLQVRSLEAHTGVMSPSLQGQEQIRALLVQLRETAPARSASMEAERALYRVLRDANDYLTSFEGLLRYQSLNDATEKALVATYDRIRLEGRQIGEEASQEISSSIRWSITLALAVFIATLLGAWLLARTLGREILRPVVALVATTLAITRGRLDERAEVIADDEIGELARSFNQMADTIALQQRSLEQLVLERTRELENERDALRERELQLRTLSDNLPDGMVFQLDTGPRGDAWRFTYLSSGVTALHGVSMAEAQADAMAIYGQVLKEDRPLIKTAVAAAIRESRPIKVDIRVRRRDGALRWHLVRSAPRRITNGHLVWDGIELDITEARQALADYHRVDQDYQMLFRGMMNGFALHEIICDDTGHPVDYRFLAVNPAFERMTGLKAQDIVGRRVLEIMPTTEVYWIETYGQVVLSGEPVFYENYSAAVGKFFEVAAYRPAPGQFACVVQDITQRKQAEARISDLAFFDQLTRLHNRASLTEHLAQALAQAGRNRSHLAVMLIDLDNFKAINDTLGHAVGDRLLSEVARRLLQCVRQSDLVARLGGDEFIIVLPDIAQPADAANVAAKVVAEIAQTYALDGHELRSSTSIGICLYPEDATEVDDLLKKADVAMYQAKASGKANFQFFKPEFQLAAERRLALEADLRRAIEHGQFVLHYQPHLDLRSGHLTGVEALVRWLHPQRGMIPPMDFIPMAEETGLIVPLGDWVLEAACRQLADWHAGGLAHIRMSVNLSAAQFADPGLAERISAVLARNGLPPQSLDLEITESMAMASPAETERIMRQIAAQGPSFSIDDFGTGYSSLAYLKRFPIRTLKIDRAFVKDIETDSNDADICEVSLLLAHKLGLEVVAEGVETPAQLAFLQRFGCEKIQGYLVSKPLPGPQAEAFIRHGYRHDHHDYHDYHHPHGHPTS